MQTSFPNGTAQVTTEYPNKKEQEQLCRNIKRLSELYTELSYTADRVNEYLTNNIFLKHTSGQYCRPIFTSDLSALSAKLTEEQATLIELKDKISRLKKICELPANNINSPPFS